MNKQIVGFFSCDELQILGFIKMFDEAHPKTLSVKWLFEFM